jgi:hypothetical protein
MQILPEFLDHAPPRCEKGASIAYSGRLIKEIGRRIAYLRHTGRRPEREPVTPLDVLGGGVLGLGDRFLSSVREEVTANSLAETGRTVVRTAAWGPAAVVAGAARAAREART